MTFPVKKFSFVLMICFLLSGPYLWAHGNKKKAELILKHHWAAPEEEKNRTSPIPFSSASVLRGKKLYLLNCAECHGADGHGNGPDAEHIAPRPSNLKAMAGHHPDGDLAWKIKKGKGPMPAWENVLSREQIWDLVNFIQNMKNTP